jgi:cytoskeleton protein RodZ
MTEAAQASAGALLRAAREQRGMTLAALAAAIKVAPRKLDALERDRLDELPDVTFARALAKTVCRHLRIDAEPVLALLPTAQDAVARRLDQAAVSLNAPLRAGSARDEPVEASWLRRPVFWIAALLLGGAVWLLYGRPEAIPRWWDRLVPSPAAVPAGAATPAPAVSASAPTVVVVEPAASVATEAASAPPSAVVVETVHSAPTGAAASAPDAAPAGLLVLRTSAESWVEVRDAAGQLLLSRTLQAGEAVGLDGALPLRATIGNAPAISVTFRGAPVDLAPATRDNIARLELK